jgi:hypothetical protein
MLRNLPITRRSALMSFGVYLTDKAGVSGGDLFPKGMNGTLRST